MCESNLQGIEGGPRGHFLERLNTIRREGVSGPQGGAMARGVLSALARGLLCEEDFSAREISISDVDSASQC